MIMKQLEVSPQVHSSYINVLKLVEVSFGETTTRKTTMTKAFFH